MNLFLLLSFILLVNINTASCALEEEPSNIEEHESSEKLINTYAEVCRELTKYATSNCNMTGLVDEIQTALRRLMESVGNAQKRLDYLQEEFQDTAFKLHANSDLLLRNMKNCAENNTWLEEAKVDIRKCLNAAELNVSKTMSDMNTTFDNAEVMVRSIFPGIRKCLKAPLPVKRKLCYASIVADIGMETQKINCEKRMYENVLQSQIKETDACIYEVINCVENRIYAENYKYK